MNGLKKKKKKFNGNTTEMSYTFLDNVIIAFCISLMSALVYIWMAIAYIGWNWKSAIICLAIIVIISVVIWIPYFRNRSKLIIDGQGIHIFSWSDFHKEIPAKEIVYHKWDDIRYVRFKMPLATYSDTYLILVNKKGQEERIAIGAYLDFFALKKLKQAIIQASGRDNIIRKKKFFFGW